MQWCAQVFWLWVLIRIDIGYRLVFVFKSLVFNVIHQLVLRNNQCGIIYYLRTPIIYCNEKRLMPSWKFS